MDLEEGNSSNDGPGSALEPNPENGAQVDELATTGLSSSSVPVARGVASGASPAQLSSRGGVGTQEAFGNGISGQIVGQEGFPRNQVPGRESDRAAPAGVRLHAGDQEIRPRTPDHTAQLLAAVRKIRPSEAGEIANMLLGEGDEAVGRFLASPLVLRKAVETACEALAVRGVYEADTGGDGFTRVVYKNRRPKTRKVVGSRGRGRGGRGTGRGRQHQRRDARGRSQVGLSKKDVRPATAERARKEIAKPGRAAKPGAGKPVRSQVPRKSAWAEVDGKRPLEWGQLSDDEEQAKDEKEADKGKTDEELDEDSHYPVDPALERAVACNLRRRGTRSWGYILWIRKRLATVVHGTNSLLRMHLPKKGPSSKLRVGSSVRIITQKTQHQNGKLSVTYRIANTRAGEEPRPTQADLPRLKAHVSMVEECEGKGCAGEAIIPLTGATGLFRAPHHENIVVGSSFMFIPAFEGTTLTIGDLPADCALTEPGPGKLELPTTRNDLVDGFLCPEGQLQGILQSKFGVDTMPFVGRVKSIFRYSSGVPLMTLLQKETKAKSLQSLYMKKIEEVLVKASLYKTGPPGPEAGKKRSEVAQLRNILLELEGIHRVKNQVLELSSKISIKNSFRDVIDRKSQESTKANLKQVDVKSDDQGKIAELRAQAARLTNQAVAATAILERQKADKDDTVRRREEDISRVRNRILELESQLHELRQKLLDEQIHTRHKHVYIPTTKNSEKFATWIKRDLGRAKKGGERLQAVVGVFVDEHCTLGSLYNTEDVPYFDAKKFPWARSFTLVDSPVSCFTMDEQGGFIPSEATRRGKRILLVELDSQFKSSGTLQKPSLLRLHRPNRQDGNVGPASALPAQEFVLVSLAADDPRFRLLRDHCGASIYRRKGSLVLLAVPFPSLEAAEKYALAIAAKPRGTFSMLKQDLYNENTLTLTCSGKRAVSAEELFYLTNAVGVLPIGGNRYRISTSMKMLEVAQVLHFQNVYIQKDKNKFVSLRDDKDRFVVLDTKRPPADVQTYYRLEPVREQEQVPAPGSWYQMSNLPHGFTEEVLLETLQQTGWWPSDVKKIWVDDDPFQPDAWFQTQSTAPMPISAVIANRPVAIVKADVPRQLLQKGKNVTSRRDPLAVLNFTERETNWKPSKKTAAVVERKFSRKPRLIRRSARPKAMGQRTPTTRPTENRDSKDSKESDLAGGASGPQPEAPRAGEVSAGVGNEVKDGGQEYGGQDPEADCDGGGLQGDADVKTQAIDLTGMGSRLGDSDVGSSMSEGNLPSTGKTDERRKRNRHHLEAVYQEEAGPSIAPGHFPQDVDKRLKPATILERFVAAMNTQTLQ